MTLESGSWQRLASSRAVRTAVAYAAAGWILIQVAATVIEPLGLPTVTLRLVILLVCAGFFVAVPIAWSLDVRRSRNTATSDSAAGIANLAARDVPVPAGPSVAVLAFADMSAARDQDYFCEGTAEEIINALNTVPGLRVASRAGSFQFWKRSVDAR